MIYVDIVAAIVLFFTAIFNILILKVPLLGMNIAGKTILERAGFTLIPWLLSFLLSPFISRSPLYFFISSSAFILHLLCFLIEAIPCWFNRDLMFPNSAVNFMLYVNISIASLSFINIIYLLSLSKKTMFPLKKAKLLLKESLKAAHKELGFSYKKLDYIAFVCKNTVREEESYIYTTKNFYFSVNMALLTHRSVIFWEVFYDVEGSIIDKKFTEFLYKDIESFKLNKDHFSISLITKSVFHVGIDPNCVYYWTMGNKRSFLEALREKVYIQRR